MTPWPRSRVRRARRVGRVASLLRVTAGLAVASTVLAACSTSSSPSSAPRPRPERVPGGPNGSYLVEAGIHKIKHVIIIEQENRSFDSYFGTYPGADGIPMKNGVPTVCVNDPTSGQCVAPYHDTADVNGGGPHGEASAVADVNGGQMNGFIDQADAGRPDQGNPADCRMRRYRK